MSQDWVLLVVLIPWLAYLLYKCVTATASDKHGYPD